MAVLAHNVLRMVRKLGRDVWPLGPASPYAGVSPDTQHVLDDAIMNFVAPSRFLFRINWLVSGPKLTHL